MEQHDIIIILGSNNKQGDMISAAQTRLAQLLDDVHFSSCMWTVPVDTDSTEQYLNCAAMGTTNLPQDELQIRLKDIEKELGSTSERRSEGLVDIDIDLLRYGTEKLHEKDWERDYVRELLDELTS